MKYNGKNNPRVIIIQKIYSKLINNDLDLNFPRHRYKKFIKDIVNGTLERNEVINNEINLHLKNDIDVRRIDKVFEVILKSAIFELLYKPTTSTNIIIKEYLIASNFFIDLSQTKFLNAVLDKLSKKNQKLMDEKDVINYLGKLAKNNPSALQLNDDIFFDKKKEIAISVDTYNEGTHFPKSPELGLLIKKIIRSSISDLICKGVKPKYYFISFTCPKKYLNKSKILKLINSLKDEQKKYKIKISGGDSTNGNFLSFTIISLGYSSKIIKRNNVKFNDDIYISGNIGDSYLGLKFIKKKIKKF